jgi:hypothetical protein
VAPTAKPVRHHELNRLRHLQAVSTITLSANAVRTLDDDDLLDRRELLEDECLTSWGTERGALLRQSLDTLTKEGVRRKLICWTI